jgi:hypothetical protein
MWSITATQRGDLSYPSDFDYAGLLERVRVIESALSHDPKYQSPAARKQLATDGERIYGEIAEYGNYRGIRRELWGAEEPRHGMADPSDWGQWGTTERRQEDALLQDRCGFLTWDNWEQVMQDLDQNYCRPA